LRASCTKKRDIYPFCADCGERHDILNFIVDNNKESMRRKTVSEIIASRLRDIRERKTVVVEESKKE